MFSGRVAFGLVEGEIPPYKTHIHARKAHARRRCRVTDRVHVMLEHGDRALLREAGNGTPGRSQSVRFIIDGAKFRL